MIGLDFSIVSGANKGVPVVQSALQKVDSQASAQGRYRDVWISGQDPVAFRAFAGLELRVLRGVVSGVQLPQLAKELDISEDYAAELLAKKDISRALSAAIAELEAVEQLQGYAEPQAQQTLDNKADRLQDVLLDSLYEDAGLLKVGERIKLLATVGAIRRRSGGGSAGDGGSAQHSGKALVTISMPVGLIAAGGNAAIGVKIGGGSEATTQTLTPASAKQVRLALGSPSRLTVNEG